MSGAIPLLPYMPSWRGRGQLYLFLCVNFFPLCVCGLLNDAVSNTDCYSAQSENDKGNLTFSYILIFCWPFILIRVFFYQLDAQYFYFNTCRIFLYMFLALLCSSSGSPIVLVQHLVSSLSLGDCSVYRLREDCVLNSHLKRVTIPDAVLIQLNLLKMNLIVLETCTGIY